jgi:hypothetical protein
MANMAVNATPQGLNKQDFIPHSLKVKLYQHACIQSLWKLLGALLHTSYDQKAYMSNE